MSAASFALLPSINEDQQRMISRLVLTMHPHVYTHTHTHTHAATLRRPDCCVFQPMSMRVIALSASIDDGRRE